MMPAQVQTMKHILVLLLSCLAANAAENWPRFRGPTGTGHHVGAPMPTKWGPENVLWRVELKGDGHSSPVNWDQRVFLTSATDKGSNRFVFAVDAVNGRLLWERTVPCASPGKTHGMNSFATPTCVTDGERVIAFLDRAGMHCFSLDGKPLWSQSLGDLPGPWGISASPILSGDRVIQNCDAQGESSIVALDKKTGKILWRTPRTEKPMGGWSTPIEIRAGTRSEVVVNSQQGLDAYDPATGKALWFCKGFNGRGEPGPDFAHGLIFVVNGLPGDVYAVRPGGSGDVSETHCAWHTPRTKVRDVSSPIVVGDYMFAIDMKGNGATTYDARTGKVLWTEKIPGTFTASPVESGGLIYINTEAGETLVIRPGLKLDLVALNSIGERKGELFRASLAPVNGKIYLRSNRALYCIGRK
jgi:outer membrane protein assembly factor BamB